jgi:RNA polymerase sigma-70 factor (ECF subfamily)
MTEHRDEELIEMFKTGNEAAFNQLVLRYQERVYMIARRYTFDHDDADDILQDVFVKVYESLKQFRGDSSFFTWLYRIVINLSINYTRKKRIKEFLRIDEEVEESTAGDDDPADACERNEQKKIVNDALKKLPERQRSVFILRFYEELPYEEIAGVMKTSVGAAKANYFHAMKKVEEYVRKKYQRS